MQISSNADIVRKFMLTDEMTPNTSAPNEPIITSQPEHAVSAAVRSLAGQLAGGPEPLAETEAADPPGRGRRSPRLMKLRR